MSLGKYNIDKREKFSRFDINKSYDSNAHLATPRDQDKMAYTNTINEQKRIAHDNLSSEGGKLFGTVQDLKNEIQELQTEKLDRELQRIKTQISITLAELEHKKISIEDAEAKIAQCGTELTMRKVKSGIFE